jgi:hypothetical protein
MTVLVEDASHEARNCILAGGYSSKNTLAAGEQGEATFAAVVTLVPH